MAAVLVVFWTGWGIHLMVVLSFALQATLLLATDFRRRKDHVLLKVLIWSAYMLADTTAIYTLGHMSVLCNWSPEKQLMALWAPLLLVHLGGQDNITAYAIEDNRLWLRHLQTFVLQVAAAVYVLHVSSIIWRPMSSKVRWAAILMFVVGTLKYGERIWALMRADNCASSSLSATSYDKVSVSCTTGDQSSDFLPRDVPSRGETVLSMAYSLLDVPKQMFEGPTSYVQINNVDNMQQYQGYQAEFIFGVVRMQLSMMYDLLYTKAAVVHTWYGLCSRVLISLPFTIVALALVCVTVTEGLDSNKKADVGITNALLVGAVILEIMSVRRAIFSKWTEVRLDERGRPRISTRIIILRAIFGLDRLLVGNWFESGISRGSNVDWSGHMRQHSLFKLASHSGIRTGSQIAKMIGKEDWWDSNVYCWSTEVPSLAITKVLDLVSTTQDITKSQGLNAIRRTITNSKLAAWIWTEELKLEERILVWHIATHVYIAWYEEQRGTGVMGNSDIDGGAIFVLREAAEVVANYMFFLLAARPYMLPYPASRQAYVQLCSDAVTDFRRYCHKEMTLLQAILNQKADLLKEAPLELLQDQGTNERGSTSTSTWPCSAGRKIGRFLLNLAETTSRRTTVLPNSADLRAEHAVSIHQHPPSINTLDRGCQLAAKLIHITAKQETDVTTMVRRSGKEEQRDRKGKRVVDGNEDTITEQETESIIDGTAVLNMVLEVWVEMLCYTAYLCNENYHAKHLTNGGEIMTIITLLMIYTKNGFIRTNATTSTSGGTASSSAQGATATDINIAILLDSAM